MWQLAVDAAAAALAPKTQRVFADSTVRRNFLFFFLLSYWLLSQTRVDLRSYACNLAEGSLGKQVFDNFILQPPIKAHNVRDFSTARKEFRF